MANTLLSTKTGLFTATDTFNICDPTAENDSEAANTAVTTGNLDSTSFVPANKAVQAVAVKLRNRAASPTGTLTVSFRNSTSPGTNDFSVTVNVSDLPNLQNDVGGWIVFKAGAAVTPNGTDSYLIRVTTSSSAQVTLYASSGNNWSREVVYSGSGAGLSAAPGSGDKIIVCGNLTGAGTSNDFTVTYDNTATTVWGASAGGNAISVNNHGILEQQVSASTAYVLNFLGRFHVAGGGIWRNNGGTAMPSTSSLTVTAQNAANVDCGIEVGPLGTVTLTGATKTVWTRLTSAIGGLCSTNGTAVTALEGQSFTGLTGTININGTNYTISSVTDATHLTLTGSAGVLTKVVFYHAGTGVTLIVSDTTGWQNGDVLCLSNSRAIAADCESPTISTVDSGTQVTTTATLIHFHSAQNDSDGDIRTYVGNLTRNVKIQGLSSTLGSYVNVNATATVTLRYVEFTKIGSATASKRGIDAATTTGTFDMQYCSVHDCTVASSIGVNITGASGSATCSNNVVYNLHTASIQIAATSGTHAISGNLCVLITPGGVAALLNLTDAGSTVTNNVAAGATGSSSAGINVAEQNAVLGVFTGNVGMGCEGYGIILQSVVGDSAKTISGCAVFRNLTGMQIGGFPNNTAISSGVFNTSGLQCAGNTNAGLVAVGAQFLLRLDTFDARSHANYPQLYGIELRSGSKILSQTAAFGANGRTHTNGDIWVSTSSGSQQEQVAAVFNNTAFNSTTIIVNQVGLGYSSYISSQKHNQTAGSHRFYTGEGTMTIDTTSGMYDVSPSLRMTPIASTSPTLRNCESAPPGMGWQVPVANGGAITFSAKVRKSVAGDGTAWNGNQPRLIVRKNVAAGISADTVLATSTGTGDGAFETLSGTTGAVTDDAVLEFMVDSGTGVASPTGWADVDTVVATAPASDASGTMKYWFNGMPFDGISGVGIPWGGFAGRSIGTY